MALVGSCVTFLEFQKKTKHATFVKVNTNIFTTQIFTYNTNIELQSISNHFMTELFGSSARNKIPLLNTTKDTIEPVCKK